MSRIRAFSREDRATSAVEFALIAPVLFLLLIGIIDLGRAVNAYVTVSNAAREGTHYLALHPTANPASIADAVRQRVSPLDPTQVTVDAFYYEGSAFQTWPPSPTPLPIPSHEPVRVSVSYPWAAATFIGSFFPGGAAATCGALTTYSQCFVVSSTVDMLR
jgi:Flp pilus assembly pilin Flp